MSFEPKCKEFDYPEAPWNACCPPGTPAKLRKPQPAATPTAPTQPAVPVVPACCCREAGAAWQYGSFVPWFYPGAAAAQCPTQNTQAAPESTENEQIEAWMEYLTGPSGLPPTEDVLKLVKKWCETESSRKAVLGVLREQLKGGGDSACRALCFVQAVPTAHLGGLVDALHAFIKGESHPYAYALAAAAYRDSAPAGGSGNGDKEKGKYRWEQWQAFVGHPRCDWRPPPEEIGKPLPYVEAPKAPDGWQWAMFNKTIMDIHAYCQHGYEWPPK